MAAPVSDTFNINADDVGDFSGGDWAPLNGYIGQTVDYLCPSNIGHNSTISGSGGIWTISIGGLNPSGTDEATFHTLTTYASPPLDPLAWEFVSSLGPYTFLFTNLGCCDTPNSIPSGTVTVGGFFKAGAGLAQFQPTYAGPPNFTLWDATLPNTSPAFWTAIRTYHNADGTYTDLQITLIVSTTDSYLTITNFADSRVAQWHLFCREYDEPMLLHQNQDSFGDIGFTFLPITLHVHL